MKSASGPHDSPAEDPPTTGRLAKGILILKLGVVPSVMLVFNLVFWLAMAGAFE